MEIRHSIKSGKLVQADESAPLLWIELIKPTNEEIENIIDSYNLPRDYLFDVNDPYELPRCEGLDSDHNPALFILSYPIKKSAVSFDTRVISIIVTEDTVITMRNHDSKAFHDLKKDNLHMEDHITRGDKSTIGNFVIQLTRKILQAFISDVKEINQQIYGLEDKVKDSTKNEHLHKMIEIQKSLINYQVANKENGPVINSIIKLKDKYQMNLREDFVHDLQVENKQASIMIEKATLMIENLSDLYSNVINNNMNTIMKVLTSFTIVLTIPTIIGGIWGMNIDLPLENHPQAFEILFLLCLVITAVIVQFLRKHDLL